MSDTECEHCGTNYPSIRAAMLCCTEVDRYGRRRDTEGYQI